MRILENFVVMKWSWEEGVFIEEKMTVILQFVFLQKFHPKPNLLVRAICKKVFTNSLPTVKRDVNVVVRGFFAKKIQKIHA